MLYGQITPPKDVNVVLFVPNAPGAFVREKYQKGEGVYGCVSVDHDATGNAKEIVLAISKAVGSTRAGVVEMTFQHETEGDNFEEQILYGGAIQLMRACFNDDGRQRLPAELRVRQGDPQPAQRDRRDGRARHRGLPDAAAAAARASSRSARAARA